LSQLSRHSLQYLPVEDDLVDRARRVVRHRVSREMLERCLRRGEEA